MGENRWISSHQIHMHDIPRNKQQTEICCKIHHNQTLTWGQTCRMSSLYRKQMTFRRWILIQGTGSGLDTDLFILNRQSPLNRSQTTFTLHLEIHSE